MAITQPSSSSPLLLGSGGQTLSPGTGDSSLTVPTVQGVNGAFQFLFNGSLQALQQAEAQAAAGTVLPPAGENLPDIPVPESEWLSKVAVSGRSEQPLVSGEEPADEAGTGLNEHGLMSDTLPSPGEEAAPNTAEPLPENVDVEPNKPVAEVISGAAVADSQEPENPAEDALKGNTVAGLDEAQVLSDESADTEVLYTANGSAGQNPVQQGDAGKSGKPPEVSKLQSQQQAEQQVVQQARLQVEPQAQQQAEQQAKQQAEQQAEKQVRREVEPPLAQRTPLRVGEEPVVQQNTGGQVLQEDSLLTQESRAVPPGAELQADSQGEEKAGWAATTSAAGARTWQSEGRGTGEAVDSLPDSSVAQDSGSSHRVDGAALSGRQPPSDDRVQARLAPEPVSQAMSAEEGQERTQPQPIGAGLRTGPDLAASRTQAEMNVGRGDLAVQSSGAQGQSMGGEGDEGESPSRRHESPQAQAAASGRQSSHASAVSAPPFSLAQHTLLSPNWGRGMGERAIMMAQHGPRVAHIQLDPPELGAMQIRIHMHGGDQVSVSFSSPNPMVREALEQQMPRLRDMFADQGLNLQDLSVTDQSSGQQSGQHEQASQGQGGGRYGSGDPAPADSALALNAVPVGLVDYYA